MLTVFRFLRPFRAPIAGVLALIVTILWARLFPELRDADRLDVPDDLRA